MPNYVRNRMSGRPFFFTQCLSQNGADMLVTHIDLLRAAYAATHQEMPFQTLAMVVLPDHLHAIWSLPPDDANYPERWRRIKARFSRAVIQRVGEPPTLQSRSKLKKRELGIWQRRYWEHRIRDKQDLYRHLCYCWQDPMRHGLANCPLDWPYSSLPRDQRLGVAPAHLDMPSIIGEFGEFA